MTKPLRSLVLLTLLLPLRFCLAGEELITSATAPGGDPVPYILNTASPTPKYVVILFPGGNGVVDPHWEGDRLAYRMQGNFLIRSRPFLVDEEFATVTTNASQVKERIQAILDDLARRWPTAQVYLMGTSRGTFDTLALAPYLSERIAGEIHTSSVAAIADLDPSQYSNRQLVVHHRSDTCRTTPYTAAQRSHDRYGTEFIAMEGGISVGDPCEAFAHHGYNGIEKETMAAIKAWIKQGG